MANTAPIKNDEKNLMSAGDVRAYLQKSSKRAAFLSLAGVVVVVAALIFSFYYLNKQLAESKRLSKEIEDKTGEIAELDTKLDERREKLVETQKLFYDFKENIDESSPEASKKAFEQTIKENPQAKEIIQDIKTSVTPKPNVTPKKNPTPNPEPSERLKTAQAKEREGFQALIAGNYDAAIAAFQAAENAYNSYHTVYELARILRKNRAQMSDPVKKKEVFQTIATKLSYGVPPDLMAQVRAIASQ